MKLPRRYKNNVGKAINGDVYVHRQYANIVVPGKEYRKAISLVPKSLRFNIVKYNIKSGVISFIHSPDFDTASEPLVKASFVVKPDGSTRMIKSGQNEPIYHHKWLFVKDDYKGFDVQQSKDRSKSWLKKGIKAKGFKNQWGKQMSESRARQFISEALWLLELRLYKGKALENGGSSIQGGATGGIKTLVSNGSLKSGMNVLDYGAGKYARNADFLRKKGMKVYAYDPYNYNSNGDGWGTGKVSNKQPSGKFDVGFTSFVLNVVPDGEANKIIKRLNSSSRHTYHIVRDKTDIMTQARNSLKNSRSEGYKFFMERYATPELKRKLQSGNLSDSDIEEFCKYGFPTKPGSFQRLCRLEEKGFKRISSGSGYWVYGK
jgi:hypothetical protein